MKTLISILFSMPQKINEGLQKTFQKSITISYLFGKRCIIPVDIICISIIKYSKVLKKFLYKNIYDSSPKDLKKGS